MIAKNKKLYLTLLVVMTIASCAREIVRHSVEVSPYEISTESALSNVKEWVNENYNGASFDIHWDEALVHRSDTAYYVETPITGVELPFLTPQSVNKYPVRMVIKVKGDIKKARLMYISPAKNNTQNLTELTYSQIGEYSGLLMYFMMDEKPTYGILFKKGLGYAYCFVKSSETKNNNIMSVSNSVEVDGVRCYTEAERAEHIEFNNVDDFDLDPARSEYLGEPCYVKSGNLDEIKIKPIPSGGGNVDIHDDGFEPIGEDLPFIDGSGGGKPSIPKDTSTKKPCVDLDKNKANPLVNMELAPPTSWNPKGGIFGMTRNGGTRLHNGIDFGAPIGTPIYATASGTIGRVVSEQPNRIGMTRNYPSNYNGDDNDAGNRIYINIGDGVVIGYWHLQAENAIAINPRTGRIYRTGDSIMIGDIVGYTGLTGNANVNNIPHLHITAKKNGQNVNPALYLNINEKLDSKEPLTTKKITTPCDK